MTKMWDSVTLRLKTRLDQINNVKEIAEEYQKAQRPVRALYAWAEDAIVPVEAIGSNIERAKQELNNTKVKLGTPKEYHVFSRIMFLLIWQVNGRVHLCNTNDFKLL